jgi:hypothetical protein
MRWKEDWMEDYLATLDVDEEEAWLVSLDDGAFVHPFRIEMTDDEWFAALTGYPLFPQRKLT